MELCNYGCGQESKFQFKNGKWCCSKSQNSCPSLKKVKGEKRRGIFHSEEAKTRMSISHQQQNLSKESLKNIEEILKRKM